MPFDDSGVNPAVPRTVKLLPNLLIRLFRKPCTIRSSGGMDSACPRTHTPRVAFRLGRRAGRISHRNLKDHPHDPDILNLRQDYAEKTRTASVWQHMADTCRPCLQIGCIIPGGPPMTIVRAHRVGMSPDPVGTDSGAMLAVARAATEHEGQKGPHVLHPGKLGGPFRLRLRLRYRDRVRWGAVRTGRWSRGGPSRTGGKGWSGGSGTLRAR